jgi:ferric-dicitrate binding protein FerR (iron transport regulator)
MQKENNKYKKIEPNILKNYLESRGSRTAQQKIANWFSDLWSNEELRKFTQKLWDKIPEDIPTPDYDRERIQGRVHHLIRLEETAATSQQHISIKLTKYITRIAAVLFIPLALFTLFNLKDLAEDKSSLATTEIISPLGARTNFILPDGSTGWLNGGSTLNFPSRFDKKIRMVRLSGEAFFDIRENSKMPFIVNTGDLKVRVCGTSFNVMSYPDDNTTEIILETGKVEIIGKDRFGRDKALGLLTPGERGVFVNGTEIFSTGLVDVDQYTAWKEGKLVLRDEPLKEVVKKMNRWYNVHIIIRDSRLENYAYHATFEDEKLDEVLKIFQQTSPIAIKELGREIHADGTYGKRTIEMYYRY